MKLIKVKSLLLVAVVTTLAIGQEPYYSNVESTMKTPVVAVAFGNGHASVVAPANRVVLANVDGICVLPYDGFSAKAVIEALPDISIIAKQLADSKELRKERYEISAALEKRGFSPVDCATTDYPNVPRLLVVRVKGGGFDSSFASFFWTLYAGNDHIVMNDGEKELMGLARPAAGSYPFFADDLAVQIRSVVTVAN
jgi:hypothetical protein